MKRKRVHSKQWFVGIVMLTFASALAACGSSEGGSNSDGALRLTTLGLCNEIPVYWAQEQGIFDDNGITVDLIKSSGGAAALTALQSGDIDLAFANPFSTMIATTQGLDLKWIATAYETTTKQENGANAITVTEDSGINSAKDLEGKTIGVNEVGGINQIITTEWLTMNGADAGTVDFVALPFNELASSVANNKVDAAQVPAQEVDPDLGLVRLTDPYVEVGEGNPLVFAGYVTTQKESDSKEKEMKAFQQSLIQANKEFMKDENTEERFDLMAEKCKQDADYLKSLNENVYEARVDISSLERMKKILTDQELVASDPSVNDLVPAYIDTKGLSDE